MFAEKLKEEIESFSDHLHLKNPLHVKAGTGELHPAQVQEYLYNAKELIKFTPVHLRTASESAKELGIENLEKFFLEKLTEEDGHDQWAAEDLEKVEEKFGSHTDRHMRLPTMQALIDYLNDAVKNKPFGYLAYTLLAEYLVVVGAPKFVKNLEEKCGITGDMLTVLTHHIELDKEHVLDDLDLINEIASDESRRPEMSKTLREVMALMDSFLGEVGSRNYHAN